ncbi:MAG: exodeoxyribonuclease VII large subunit, partial [bacterium]
HLTEGRIFRDPFSIVRSLHESVDEDDIRLFRAMSILMERSGERLVHTDRLLNRLHPSQKVKDLFSQITEQKKRLINFMILLTQKHKQALSGAMGALDALSPLNVLQRGYSLCMRLPDEKIIRKSEELRTGDHIKTRFHKGDVISEVKDVH